MKAELINDADPRWASFLRNSHHDFYHLPAYAALSARQEGGDAAALLVGDGTGTMLLPIVLRSIQGSRLDAVSPYGYPGSLVSGTDDPSFADRALHAGLDLLRSAGVVSLFVRLHPLLNPVPPKGHGRVALHGSTVSVDLTLPSEVLWRQMRENHRRDIRRALKTGLRPAFDDSWTHFETFKRLYRATMDRVSAEARYFFDDRYFDELRSALQERLKLCVVEVDGVIAGAGLFVETCGIVQYHLSGTDDAFTGGPPTKLMLQFVGEWARTRGDIRLHLGGGIGATADSLFDFKAGFSPDRHAFHTWRSVLDEAEYARLESLRGGAPNRDDFFPSYRRPPT